MKSQPSAKPWWAIHFGAFAVMLAVTMPPLLRAFSPTRDPLDTSWTWMMGYSLQHHLQWGKSIVFTYGPLGFLTDSYFYSDHLLWGLSATIRLTSWLIFGLGFACILHKLAPDGKPSLGRTALVAVGWIIGASFLDLSTQSAVMGVLLLVLALVEEEGGTAVTVELVLAGSLLALGALIKSTALVVSLFALLLYPALWRHAERRRSAPASSLIPLLSFCISFSALWLFASQSLSNLPAYFRGTWEIVSGYTPAMSVTGMRIQIQSALAVLLLLAGVFVGFHLGGRKVRVAQWLLLGGVAFFAWKEGFTLQDPGYVRHPMTFFGTALLIASVGTVLVSNENPRYLRTCVFGAYAVALLSSILGYPPASPTHARVLDNYYNYFSLISSKSRRVAEERAQTLAIQEQYNLHGGLLSAVGHASVNVMPWSLMMAQGYHMRLIASPIMQSYSVYTPYLDEVNARQIWNGGSADKIIYRYGALGYRYPPFDEPATFRAILTCYRTEYPGDPFAVLSHVACAPSEMRAADKPEEATFGRWILVPRQASYVEIEIHPTVIGRLTDILYQADHVWVALGLASGSVAGPFQLVYPVAKDGLFIRYFTGTQSDAAALFSGNPSSLQRVAAIQILTSPRSLDFAKHFRVRFLYQHPGPG